MIQVRELDDLIEIDNGAISAVVRKRGYVSGVAGGTFVDKATGARDLGFGLSIVDFLLEPLPPGSQPQPGGYRFGGEYRAVHGDIPKRYVEGPQICTQARELRWSVFRGEDAVALRTSFRWSKAYPPYRAGSLWEQTLIFPAGTRYFFSADRVTSANRCPALVLRVDMPGHIRHHQCEEFEHVYLSYFDMTLPCNEFLLDFPPDEKFLYRREEGRIPDRFYRAYQVKLAGEPGPWLAGMTLDAATPYEAWCHQRGYVCLIQEQWGRPVQPGDVLGAAYLIGWFDDRGEMDATYDRYRGWNYLELRTDGDRLVSWTGVPSIGTS